MVTIACEVDVLWLAVGSWISTEGFLDGGPSVVLAIVVKAEFPDCTVTLFGVSVAQPDIVQPPNGSDSGTSPQHVASKFTVGPLPGFPAPSCRVSMQADRVVDEVAQRSGSFNLNTIPSEPAFNSLVFVSKLTIPGAFNV